MPDEKLTADHMPKPRAVGIQIQIDTPYLSAEEYAARAGLAVRMVREMVQEGRLPTMPRKNGRERIFINNALLLKQALDAEF